MTEKLYEITVYTENQVGLLSTVAGMFTRRSLNIESLRVFPSPIPGVHKFTIKSRTTEDRIRAVVLSMEKKVDVIKAFSYEDPEHDLTEMEIVEKFLAERENNK